MIAAQPAFHRMAPEAPQEAALRRSAWAAALSLLLHGLAVAAMLGVVLRPEAPAGEAVFTVELLPAASAAAGQPQMAAMPTAPDSREPDSREPDSRQHRPPEPEPRDLARAAAPAADAPPEPVPVELPEPLARVEAAEADPMPLPEPKPRPRQPATAKARPEAPPAKTAPAETATAQAPPAPAAMQPAEPIVASASAARATGQQAAASQPAAATAGSSDEPPVITEPRFRLPPKPPEYPPRARAMEQQGVSVVRALVDTDGTSREIRLWRSSGFDALDRAALVAVRGWRFEAARRGEQPVLAWVEIPIRFEIR